MAEKRRGKRSKSARRKHSVDPAAYSAEIVAAKIKVEADSTEVIKAAPLELEIIGCCSHRDIQRRKSTVNLEPGDWVFFMLPWGDTTVYRGDVGPRGNIISIASVISGQKNVIDCLKQFGNVGVIQTETNGQLSSSRKSTKMSTSSNNASANTKLADNLPTDEAELRSLLASAPSKSEKSKIRRQLRKVSPNWAKSK